MEIALNPESKRKTAVAVAFRDGERTFGSDAMAVAVKYPKNCYFYLLDLLGKTVDHPSVKLYQVPLYKKISWSLILQFSFVTGYHLLKRQTPRSSGGFLPSAVPIVTLSVNFMKYFVLHRRGK